MRYSYTALALALATATQVTAHEKLGARHAHAAFHAKKDAGLSEAEKRDVDWKAALADVNWSAALADVDWSSVSVTYSQGQTFGTSTSASSAFPTSTSISVISSPVAVQQSSTATSITVAASTALPVTTPSTTLATSTTLASISLTAATAVATGSSSDSPVGNIISGVVNHVEEAVIKALGIVSAGVNGLTDEHDIWIGIDGAYTMDVHNNAGEDLVFVCWGPLGSWINSVTPAITLSVPAGDTTTISFKSGASGACGSFYSDTILVLGQLFNTWLEFTMGETGVFDISREVNMNGHTLEVVGPKCTSNMDTCSFHCKGGLASCEYNYELINCENGSQAGATFGTFEGADSGGCGGLGSSAHMHAYFS